MIDVIQFIWLIFCSFIGVFLLIIIGYTILSIFPKNNYFNPLQRLALSYGLGTGFLSLTMFIFILLGVHARLSFIPIIVITIIFFIKLKIFKNLKTDLKTIVLSIKNSKFNLIEYSCIIILATEIVIIFCYWFIYPIYRWDAIAIWDAKAKYLFFDGNLDFLSWHIPNEDYPLLVPLNLTFFYSIFFQYHYFSKILFTFFFIFLILFIFSSLRFFKLNRTYSLLIVILIGSFPSVFEHATIAYADLTLTFFYTISIILLFYYFKTKETTFLFYSAFFMGFMAWTKNEGIGLLAVNLGIFIIYNTFILLKKNIRFKKYIINLLIILIIPFSIYLPWFLTGIIYELPSDTYTSHLIDLFSIEKSIQDLDIIFKFITTTLNISLIFWILFLLMLIINYDSILKEEVFFLILLIIFHFLLYIGIYIITPFNLEWHLQTSFEREILHLIPICGFLNGMVLSNKKIIQIDFKRSQNYKIIGILIIVSISIFIVISIF